MNATEHVDDVCIHDFDDPFMKRARGGMSRGWFTLNSPKIVRSSEYEDILVHLVMVRYQIMSRCDARCFCGGDFKLCDCNDRLSSGSKYLQCTFPNSLKRLLVVVRRYAVRCH